MVTAPKPRPPAPIFEPGNTCYLKSGSCQMTVERVVEYSGVAGALDPVLVHVVWQQYDTKNIIRDAFAPALLNNNS